MNFKTTIVLFILLVGVGAYVLVTHVSKPEPKAPEVHTLLDIKAPDVTAISITNADGKEVIAAAKSVDANAQAVWRLTKPVSAAADTFKVGSLVEDLTSLKSTNEVPDTGADAPKTGVDHPQYTVVLSTGSKQTKLLVGDALPVGDGVYVKVDGAPQTNVVAGSVIGTLEKPASDLRKTQLFETNSSAVQQFTVTHKDGSRLVLQKQPKGWQIIEPAAMPADQFAVEDLLSAVLNLTPVGFVDDATDAIGLNHPNDTVTFSTTAPATQPAATTAPTDMPGAMVVKFGGYDDVEKKNVFVALPDGSIVKAAASVLDSLNKKPFELRDKTVMDLDPDKVQSLTIATNAPATTQPVAAEVKKTITLLRRPKKIEMGPMLAPVVSTTGPSTKPTTAPVVPETIWALAADKPTDKPADADDSKVAGLLGQFHPLKADKYLDHPASTQPSKRFTLTFTVTGQAAPTVLTLTDPGNDQPLVGSCNGLIFEMSRSIATDLAGEFRK